MAKQSSQTQARKVGNKATARQIVRTKNRYPGGYQAKHRACGCVYCVVMGARFV